jgi:hypothetical protein
MQKKKRQSSYVRGLSFFIFWGISFFASFCSKKEELQIQKLLGKGKDGGIGFAVEEGDLAARFTGGEKTAFLKATAGLLCRAEATVENFRFGKEL